MDTTRKNEPVNVICLYWIGKFRRRDFTVEDVRRLNQSVSKHIDRPYEFYCLTNDMKVDIPACKIPLKHNWPGWWSKMELHRPDLPAGRTLYLDLDSHVVNSLAPILDYPGNLVMFNTRASKWKQKHPEAGWVYRYQAATMLFDPGSMDWMYDKFLEDPNGYMKKFRSDQDVMGEWIPNQPTFPDNWMLKLATCRNLRNPPKETIIITGQPGDGLFRRLYEVPWLEGRAREETVKE